MFGRKKKEEPKWELEGIYNGAIERLQRLEETAAQEEEDILADMSFSTERLGSATGTEKTQLLARLEADRKALEEVKSKYDLRAQREYVQDLSEKREAWLSARRPKKVSKDTWVASAVTVGVALSGSLVEACGRIPKFLKKIPLPKTWK